MKPWIKLEFSLLQDARIERLVEELGTKGLGVYTIIRLLVECRNDGEMSINQLLAEGSEYTSRRIISRVVNDFDLFTVDDDGLVRASVRACVRESAPASVRTSVRASVRTDAHASVRTGEHIVLNFKEKENIEIDIEGEGEKAPTTSSMDSIQRVREWLLDDSNLIWREPMMMHSGYGSLLQLHWPEAVEFFIQHMLAQDKLDRMYNEHEAKQYFSNFSKIGLGSGKALMEHLSQLNNKIHNETESLIADPESLIGNLPPKPSPTAVWSYATDSWTEIH